MRQFVVHGGHCVRSVRFGSIRFDSIRIKFQSISLFAGDTETLCDFKNFCPTATNLLDAATGVNRTKTVKGLEDISFKT